MNILISFHNRDVLCTLSRLLVRPGFRLVCARLAVHYYDLAGFFFLTIFFFLTEFFFFFLN